MRKNLIECDTCGADISMVTGPFHGYRITVGLECVPAATPQAYSNQPHPSVVKPLDRDYEFCSLDCLRTHPVLGHPREPEA